MNISIIIPAWHEEKTIVKTLNCLDSLDYSLKEVELIIVASADDNTYSLSKNKNIGRFGRYLVLKQEPGGKNTALQQGIESSHGEIIVLLDADTIVDKNWLTRLVEPIQKGKSICTNGNFFPIFNSILNNYFMIEKVWGRQLTKKQSTQGKGSVALKRDVIDQIGINILFNKNISSGVDHYLGERIIERGYSIEFIENARTKSYLNHTIKGFITDQTRWNMGYFQQITRFEAAKILFFNMVLIFSLIILIASFFVHPYLASPFIFYSTYLFIQCAASSIYTSNLSLLIYFPIYLLLNLIDRTITIKSFLSNFFSQSKNNIHFKGERL